MIPAPHCYHLCCIHFMRHKSICIYICNFLLFLRIEMTYINNIFLMDHKDLAILHTHYHMMKSSNGKKIHVTVLLCGEFTDHRWIPLTKASLCHSNDYCWCPDDARSQTINSHGIDQVFLEYSCFRTTIINSLSLSDTLMHKWGLPTLLQLTSDG